LSERDLENDAALGEGLISLGLFGACFEAMVLAFRSKTQEWLIEYEPARLDKFYVACRTAYTTFEFCGPVLIANGAMSESDFLSLSEIRERRNELTHDAYNHLVTLRLADLASDLNQIDRITTRVVNWRFEPGPYASRPVLAVGESKQFTVNARVITYLFRELAEDLVHRRLRVSTPGASVEEARAV
jgi:hypothetical protein